MSTFTAKIAGMRKSAVIWVNGLLLAALPVVDYAKDNLPQLADYLSPDLYKRVGLAVVVLNILLRFRTSQSLADK
jgi:hypothetical protein